VAAIAVAAALAVLPGVASAQSARTPSPAGAAVYFIDIKDGAVLPEKFTIRFGLRNMGLAPAGMPRAGTGHHHILVDADTPAMDRPIPNDPKHLHFGAGQTEAEVTLPPGPHTLQLIFADHDHVPHDPPLMSERIRIVVQGAGAPAVAGAPAAGGTGRRARPPEPPCISSTRRTATSSIRSRPSGSASPAWGSLPRESRRPTPATIT
jgi:hypothetical protein